MSIDPLGWRGSLYDLDIHIMILRPDLDLLIFLFGIFAVSHWQVGHGLVNDFIRFRRSDYQIKELIRK